MLWTYLQSFSFIPHIASEEFLFLQKFSFLVATTTNQIERFGHKVIVSWRTTQQIFPKNFCQNNCSEIEKMPIFTFPIISQWKL